MPTGVALSTFDEMLMLSIQGGHVEAMLRLLDAGARVDGDPNCHEIPKEPYAEIVRILLAAGATIPARISENGTRASMLVAELGLEPPA